MLSDSNVGVPERERSSARRGAGDRAALMARLAEIEQEWEAIVLPDTVERILSIRLTTQQLKVLSLVLPEPDGGAMQDLAAALDVSLATISGIVDRLEAHGMVARVTDATDHRVRRVVVTDDGRAAIRTVITSPLRPHLDALDRMSTEDLRALVRGMNALHDAMRQQP